MPLKYKIDVLSALKEKGYTSYKLANEKIFGSGSIQKLRKGEMVSLTTLDTICTLLNCDINDIIYHTNDD